jgi:hypothetical protein
VLHVLSNFLRLKKNFKVAGGSGKFRTINFETMMLGRVGPTKRGGGFP